MSSAAERRTPPPPLRHDHFRYGVRYIRKLVTNGKWEYVATPMPKEALLHPGDEDYPFEPHLHNEDRTYLRNAISSCLPPGWFVVSALRVDWGVPGIQPHGPDISVFKGLCGREKNWQTLAVAKEKVKPIAVVEIATASTRHYDLRVKVVEYFRAGVSLYAIVDTRDRGDVRRIQIIGYRNGPTGYEKMALDDRGRLLLEPLGLLLGAESERVRCWEGRTGEPIPSYAEVVRETEAIGRRTRQLHEELKRLRSEF